MQKLNSACMSEPQCEKEYRSTKKEEIRKIRKVQNGSHSNKS